MNDTGYNKVEMIINPHQGIFSLERLFDDNKIIVNEITDGRKKFYKEYNARNGNNIISHFWLSMIGIDNPLQIIKNESFVRQNFGWRTFSPSTLISQNKIDSETSVLLPDMRQQTAFLVCFIYFMRMISMIQKKKKQKNKERFEENQ